MCKIERSSRLVEQQRQSHREKQEAVEQQRHQRGRGGRLGRGQQGGRQRGACANRHEEVPVRVTRPQAAAATGRGFGGWFGRGCRTHPHPLFAADFPWVARMQNRW